MIPMQQVLLKLLRILRFVRDYIVRRAARRWSLFTAFLGRRMSEFRPSRSWNRKPGTSRHPRTAEPSLPRNRAGSYSVSGGSAVLREYVVAASTVPLAASSASLASLQEDSEDARQSASVPPSPTTSTPINLSIHQPHPLASFQEDARQSASVPPFPTTSTGTSINLSVHQPHPPYGRNRAASSSGNLSGWSAQSRASESLSRIVNSRELLPVPVNQPPRPRRGIHRQFGPAVDPPISTGQLSRSPSPTHRQNITNSDSRLAITTTYVHSHPHDSDEGRSPVVPPSSSSSMHEPRRPLTNRNKWSGSSTSIDLSIQSPSTDSLPTNFETASQHSSIASSATLPEDRTVYMIHSEQIELSRYNNATTIPRKKKKLILNPSTTTFPYFPNSSHPDQNCAPWKAATHPDGALYFYDPKRRLFTDTDMYNTDLRGQMEDFYLYLEMTLRFEKLTIPSKKNYDLVLDIMLTETKKSQWSYYYACHEARCLFWLDEYNASSEIHGVESPAHFKHRLEDLYWSHWALYPAVFKDRRLPLHVYDELMGMLAHGCIDTLTSKLSTLPYDDEKMSKMISLVQNAKGAKAGLEHYTAGTTRLLSFFAHWRFLYFHGQRHARLLKDQTVYDEPKLFSERSRLIRFLSPLLFRAPNVHLREMKELWTDGIIIEITWKNFMTKLQDEWNGFIIWSTVMLAVNVGFLTLPGVMFSSTNSDTLKSVHQEIFLPSSSQIASTLSAEASVGSILIGLFLVRHNRTKQELDPTEASTYLSRSSQSLFGLEAMAIIFSLPWALLLWSMVTFSVALLLFGLVVSNLWTQAIVALTSFPLLAFTLWCIWICGDSSSDGGTVPARLEFLLNVVESLRIRRPTSESSDDGSSRHSPSSSRSDVSGV